MVLYKIIKGQTKIFPSSLKALAEKIHAQPFPGLNIDNLPFFVPIATQAKGTTFIFDWVYEERAIYYTELNKLGAKVVLADPHRAYVSGKTKLTAAEVSATLIMLEMKGRIRNVGSMTFVVAKS